MSDDDRKRQMTTADGVHLSDIKNQPYVVDDGVLYSGTLTAGPNGHWYVDAIVDVDDDDVPTTLSVPLNQAYARKPKIIKKPHDSQADNAKLRYLLAMAYSGFPKLYGDDGELSDSSESPFIDYRRDTVDEIERKITERGQQQIRKATEAEPNVIVVEVSGGVVQDVWSVPAGVAVEVRDYDNGKDAKNDPDGGAVEDGDGEFYVPAVHGADS